MVTDVLVLCRKADLTSQCDEVHNIPSWVANTTKATYRHCLCLYAYVPHHSGAREGGDGEENHRDHWIEKVDCKAGSTGRRHKRRVLDVFRFLQYCIDRNDASTVTTSNRA